MAKAIYESLYNINMPKRNETVNETVNETKWTDH